MFQEDALDFPNNNVDLKLDNPFDSTFVKWNVSFFVVVFFGG